MFYTWHKPSATIRREIDLGWRELWYSKFNITIHAKKDFRSNRSVLSKNEKPKQNSRGNSGRSTGWTHPTDAPIALRSEGRVRNVSMCNNTAEEGSGTEGQGRRERPPYPFGGRRL